MALSSKTAHHPTLHRQPLVSLCLVVCALCLLWNAGFTYLSQPTLTIPPQTKAAPAKFSWQRATLILPAQRAVPLIHQTPLTPWHLSNVSLGRTFFSGQAVGSLMIRVQLVDSASSHYATLNQMRLCLNVQVACIPLLI